MTQEEIIKAFNNRWRIKREANADVFDHLGGTYETLIRSICRDFFETGICLGEGEHCQPIPMSAIVKAAEEVAFDEWWNLYDKKIDKAKCQKKWQKLTDEERMACIAATPAYVASTPDIRYRRHPMTYLNNKSWENQIIPHNGNKESVSCHQQQQLDKLSNILSD